jgi:hypothetical protein
MGRTRSPAANHPSCMPVWQQLSKRSNSCLLPGLLLLLLLCARRPTCSSTDTSPFTLYVAAPS